jgi:hypothetical protein
MSEQNDLPEPGAANGIIKVTLYSSYLLSFCSSLIYIFLLLGSFFNWIKASDFC